VLGLGKWATRVREPKEEKKKNKGKGEKARGEDRPANYYIKSGGWGPCA